MRERWPKRLSGARATWVLSLWAGLGSEGQQAGKQGDRRADGQIDRQTVSLSLSQSAKERWCGGACTGCGEWRRRRMPSPKGGGKKKGSGKSPKTGGGPKSSPAKARPKSKAKKVEEEPLPPDADIVVRVSRLMKSNKLSQVQVGQEARVSQAVISQWLARKYVSTHTHPPPPLPFSLGAAGWTAVKALHCWNRTADGAAQIPRAQRQGGQGDGGLVGGAAQRDPSETLPYGTHRVRPFLPGEFAGLTQALACNGLSQNELVAPLVKEGTTSVLRPSHHKQPVKRKTVGQVSKAQIQAQIEESATGLTIGEDASGVGGKRKRKRPPQLTEALGGDGPRSSRRRGDGRIFSPSEFAPINALGQLEVCS